jgi:hypothetical protein
MAPTLASASPAAAAIGSQVTLTGTNFTATANHLKIGAGYLHNLPSSDGTTILFTVPSGVDACAPGQQVCPLLIVVLSPGDLHTVGHQRSRHEQRHRIYYRQAVRAMGGW